MIGAQDERLDIADYDVPPVGQACGYIRGYNPLYRDIAAIAVAMDHAAIGKSGLSEFFTEACLMFGVTFILDSEDCCARSGKAQRNL